MGKNKIGNSRSIVELPLFQQPSELPSQDKFPINEGLRTVGSVIERDLLESTSPYIITGFSSLWYLVSFLGRRYGWEKREAVKVVFGFELKEVLGRPRKMEGHTLAEEAELLEEGLSLKNWGNLWRLIKLVEINVVQFKFLNHLHAKIYVGDGYATLGSSNFSAHGLSKQPEANIRVEAKESQTEQEQYTTFHQLAKYFFSQGKNRKEEMLALLKRQLLLTDWQETLARAISELLEKPWHKSVKELRDHLDSLDLWHTQEDGINQALQILQKHQCVLIADPTGSGKTRMVTTLTLILSYWLWLKGNTFKTRIETICPKQVKSNWEKEADKVSFVWRHAISDGAISSGSTENKQAVLDRLKAANLLVIDEAHRYLNPFTGRTKSLKRNQADFMLLVTATPLSKQPKDIMRLIELVGVDVLPDEQLIAFKKLRKDLKGKENKYQEEDLEKLRDYLKHLLVRRTKKQINSHFDLEPTEHKNIEGKFYKYPESKNKPYSINADRVISIRLLR